VTVRAGGSGRASIAGLVATRPDRPAGLLYRMRLHRGRKGEPKALTEEDYIGLLDRAHQQLGGPIVLVWDNLSVHRSARMRALIAARPWLTVFFLPPTPPGSTRWSRCGRTCAGPWSTWPGTASTSSSGCSAPGYAVSSIGPS
jgi:hypothetical protein